MSRGAILPNRGLADRLSALFWRRPTVLLLLLITPPLLWLGVVYLGSLGALLLQSFYSIDEFSGVVVEEFTLKTYGELFRAANMDIILRTLTMSASVTLASAVIGCAFTTPPPPYRSSSVFSTSRHCPSAGSPIR